MTKKLQERIEHAPMAGLRGPAWRQRIARSLPQKLSSKVAKALDPLVRQLHQSLVDTTPRSQSAKLANQRIANANEVEANSTLREKLKCMVLSDFDRAEMTARLELDSEVIETWELLNFDVRPMLEAKDWIALHVIEPLLQNGNVPAAARLQLCYSGGPLIGRLLLDDDSDLSLDKAEAFLGHKLRLALKLREAYSIPLQTPQEAAQVMKLGLEVQRLGLVEEQLTESALQAARQHELKLERLKLDQQRAAERNSKTARRESALKAAAAGPLASLQPEAGSITVRKQLQRKLLVERMALSPLAQIRWQHRGPDTTATVNSSVTNCSLPTARVQAATGTLPSYLASCDREEGCAWPDLDAKTPEAEEYLELVGAGT